MNFHFHSDQVSVRNKWAENMLMSRVDVKQGLVLKTTCFNDSESTLYFESITLYMEHFQIYNFAGCFHSLIFAQKSIIGAL